MKHFFVILFLLVIYSCNTPLPQIEVSTGEKKALDSIASIYGGNISLLLQKLILKLDIMFLQKMLMEQRNLLEQKY